MPSRVDHLEGIDPPALLADTPITSPRAVAAPVLAPAPRALLREHRAIVVLDRNRPTLGRSALPSGWNTVFANARVADLFEHLFAEADIDWAATVLPEIPRSSADVAEPAGPAHPALVTYNGRL